MPAATDAPWTSRPVLSAATPDKLASLIASAEQVHDGLLFTATPREELDAIGTFSRLADLAWAGQVRAIVAAWNRASDKEREFAGDEVALAVGMSPTSGALLVRQALDASSLFGLVEAVESNLMNASCARTVLRELDKVSLTREQRQAVVFMLLNRLTGQTPGELAKLLTRLILLVDLEAAQNRQDKATRDRRVRSWTDTDGQAVLTGRGPVEQIAAVRARLAAELDRQNLDPSDSRTREQREYDLFISLLTTGTLGDSTVPDYEVAVIVPFSVAEGGELELAEVPGYGPILPSTARDLLEHASTLSQVAVNEHGQVIAVSDPLPGPRQTPENDPVLTAIKALTGPPIIRDLSTGSYRISKRLRRHLEARDRTCVFPGCSKPALFTDKDHRIPWPQGPTALSNLQCLCRRHHRAKQTLFTVTAGPDGELIWTTRGGWTFLRLPQGY